VAARTKVAVVGTGDWWGREHCRVFAERPDCELVAVVGRRPEKAAERAAEFGTRGYADLAEMLASEQPDLVSTTLPNEGHFEPTLQLIRAGVPLLVEKPLVFDLAQARTLVDEAAARDLFFAINFNHRYATPVQMAAATVPSDAFGQLTFATWRFGGEPGTSAHAHANLIETQCHGFDLLEHLCGPIDSVMAQMADVTGRGYSSLVIALHFANGAVGSIVGSYDSSYAYPQTHRVELGGTVGRIVIDDTVKRYTYSRAGSEVSEVWEAGYFNDEGRQFYRLFDRHVDDVLAALRAGSDPPIHARAGLRALQLAHWSIESFETGRRVATSS
jgi:predicted dehydrogenase